MNFSESFFAAKFGIARRDLENYLEDALSRGGDSADLSPEKIKHAAQVAAMIAAGPAKVEKTPLEEGARRNLYPVLTATNETAFRERVELAQRADRAARAYDPRVFQV